MFARRGAIIPTRDVIQFTGEKPFDVLMLEVFPAASKSADKADRASVSETGRGIFYHDDGLSYDYRDGEFIREEYACEMTDRGATFKIAAREGNDAFAPPIYQLCFRSHRRSPAAVKLGDVVLPLLKKKSIEDRAEMGWWHDKKSRTVFVRVARLDASVAVVVEMGDAAG
ncbi:MAG: DUF5110 domain-containing protein [Planctomycetes bacterium]|nr:DUF5110 domain-containing protein [Planctomycetota bacterium]